MTMQINRQALRSIIPDEARLLFAEQIPPDFQSYVEERGLFYPPDPGERRRASAATSARTPAACVRSSTA